MKCACKNPEDLSPCQEEVENEGELCEFCRADCPQDLQEEP